MLDYSVLIVLLASGLHLNRHWCLRSVPDNKNTRAPEPKMEIQSKLISSVSWVVLRKHQVIFVLC